MKIDLNNYEPFFQNGESVYFSKKDRKKIDRMKGGVDIISTICPDYPNDGKKYTFQGNLGDGVSLTAKRHLEVAPRFIAKLENMGLRVKWILIVADLPELVDSQQEFYERVADSKNEYLRRCQVSVEKIRTLVNGQSEVLTFESFYKGVDYISSQTQVAENILKASECEPFRGKFNSFMFHRASLARLFRGRNLSAEELEQATAHGMSLYVSHGTLLRKMYQGKNLIVLNHMTPNLQNFYLARFANGCEDLENTLKFPLGIIDGELY